MITNRNIIILLTGLFLFSGCALTKHERRSNRAVKKLKQLEVKYADVWNEVDKVEVRIDTVIERIEVPGETIVQVDTTQIARLVKELDSARTLINLEDPSTSDEVAARIITKYVPSLIEIPAVEVDTMDIHLRIWYNPAERALKYNVQKDSSRITATASANRIQPVRTVTVNKIPWWIWLIIIVITLFAMRDYLPKVNIPRPPWLP